MKPHSDHCLCRKCIQALAEKARRLYEENKEDIDLLVSINFPLARELKELAMMAHNSSAGR
ncbi:hypothetical protein [Candidatus Pyrohabitans sp.]